MFTTYGYANLGLPKFADSPFYTLAAQLNPDGEGFIDHGLAKTTGNPADDGKFRIPTLRNVAKTGPYGHNGYVHRLDEFIALDRLPPPEVPATANRMHSANPLSRQDIADVTAFLRALSDD